MVDADIVTSKLSELTDRISRVRSRCPDEPEQFRHDRDALDLVSFNLMLAVQTCVDIASHIIADEGWKPAVTLADSFRRLCENGVITSPVADSLGRASGLRNVVAHGYAGIDVEKIYHAATASLKELEQYSREVSAWLQRRLTG